MRRILIAVIFIFVLAGALVLWYLVSPLFLNKVVDEKASAGEVLYLSSFVDADAVHKVSGLAKIVSVGNSKELQFENFQATNGPDLKVYLSKDLNAEKYYSLGDLKGNIGNQNYDIPNEVNIKDYDYILIWCERFSVLFGSARIN